MTSHQSRSDSPNMLQNHLNSPHINNSYHGLHNSSHLMYNSSHLPVEYSHSDPDIRKQNNKNGFPTPSYRSPPFNPFIELPRHASTSVHSSNYQSTYSPDMFPQHIQASDPQSQLSSHLSHGRYDIGGLQSSQGVSEDAFQRQSFVGVDQFGNSDAGTVSMQQANNLSNAVPNPQAQQLQQSSYSQVPYINGLTHMQSQTPYGPHLAGSLSQAGPISTSTSMHLPNGTGQNSSIQQEEISTIFVVGFPDDMQEREFQNMFTFSSGFEAATLKIPNKELTSYGSNANAGSTRYQQPYAGGSNDPYTLATVNQGGVVVDNGRDGPTSSWPVSTEDSHYLPSTLPQPPRKQIIGFAKFRTRSEALEARDILQGRRVDIEKGAVLKAEMAKKNLHTKRGPVAAGPPGLSSLVGASTGAGDSVSTLNALHSGEPMSARERELGALGAMGFGARKDRVSDSRDDEDRDRRNAQTNSSTRGARERAEEDERERERKRQEKDAARLRSAAFDAFHSVPPQIPRLLSQNSLSSTSGNGRTVPSHSTSQESLGPIGSGVWGMTANETSSRKQVVPIHIPDVSPRPNSPQNGEPSPPKSTPFAQVSRSAGSDTSSHKHSDTFSPSSNTLPLPSHPSLPSRPRPYSPTSLDPTPSTMSSQPSSSASSVDGSGPGSNEGEVARTVAGLSVSTDGSSSPQLPSPASVGGSGSGTGATPRGNPGDQNPPINTLYVGNLPSSPPPPGYPPGYLEDELRELFGRRPGYRKLCFRQKNNGPMCFVEFEDVRHATKALHELHGNSLNGLVKGGGIRLSYSKNPLGVRTPTSATGAGLQTQHKEYHSAPPGSAFFPSEPLASRQLGQSEHTSVVPSRRDTLSQQQSYQYTMSPPAPRFSVSSPTTTHYTTSTTQLPSHASAFPRSIQSQYALDTVTNSTFLPFRTSPHLDQFGADTPASMTRPDRFGHALSPPPVNGIETSRAG